MWNEQDGALVREFRFKDFKSALAFVNKIGVIAETLNHHPDIELGWGRVKVTTVTHSAGKITDKDKELAKRINDIPQTTFD